MRKRKWTPKRIIAIRDALAMHQRRFAETLGVTRETVCRWEHGQRTPHGLSVRALLELEARAGTTTKGGKRNVRKKSL